MQSLRYIDLFAGVGGFRYGVEQGFNNQQAIAIEQVGQGGHGATDQKGRGVYCRPPAPLCVYSNEWDKYANSVYRGHYEKCDNRDIRTVTTDEIPDCDLIVGGFPCQAFSIAGKRGGFDDTRGTLFFEIARIAQAKRPRLLLLENVKGLLSHDSGRTFATILTTLAQLGYDAEWQLFDSQNHGVPQHRERVYIVGHLRGGGTQPILPLTGNSTADNRVSQSQVAGTIDTGYYKNHRQSGSTYIKVIKATQKLSDAMRIRGVDGPSATLKGLGGGLGAKTGLYAVRQPLRFVKRNQKNFDGDYAFTVDAGQTSGVRIGYDIRRLTPVECERLQGFPDGWTEYGEGGIKMSDTQRYKMMGNAATTNVVRDVMQAIFAMLYPIDNTVQ